MSVDIYNTRRGYFNKCKWYARDEDTGESNEIIISRPANGIFYAKEIAAQTSQDKVINGMFLFDQDTITIESQDSLTGIKRGCLVEYNGKIWHLINVQESIVKKQREFTHKTSATWYLQLRA